jgi:hypothetical protein
MDQLRHEVPMLWSEAVNVRAAVQVDYVLVTRVLPRCDGPNKMAVDRALRNEVLALVAFCRFAVGTVAAFNALPHAIDSSLHAHQTQENVDRLALNAGHFEAPPNRTGQEGWLPDWFYSFCAFVPFCG